MRVLLTGCFLPAAFLGLACPAMADPPVSQTATYQLVFRSTWSSTTHPQSFPPSPHFSGLIGGTHGGSVAFWQPGQLATAGIKQMAEWGSKTVLQQEVQAAINAGTAENVVSGPGIGRSPGSATVTFQISQSHPLVSVVSMLAPSPDWFVGTNGTALFENGDWVQEKVVTLFTYDAGTDSGPSYTSPNQVTNPPQPIHLITTGPLGNGVPAGTYTFTRTDTPSAWTDLGLGLAGSNGTPAMTGNGTLVGGSTLDLNVSGAAITAPAVIILGNSRLDLPFAGGTLVPSLDAFVAGLQTDGAGQLSISTTWPTTIPSGVLIVAQTWVLDGGGLQGFAATNAICSRTR